MLALTPEPGSLGEAGWKRHHTCGVLRWGAPRPTEAGEGTWTHRHGSHPSMAPGPWDHLGGAGCVAALPGL